MTIFLALIFDQLCVHLIWADVDHIIGANTIQREKYPAGRTGVIIGSQKEQ
jgi:hypothetical protein